jgi:DNA-nicking Smr family endonuclease
MAKGRFKKPFIITKAERQIFLDAIERLSFHAPPICTSYEVEMPSRQLKKNKKVDATLDLHGLTREAASRHLKLFIERCLSLGHQRILVIHGKGSGILREYVRGFLAEHSYVVTILDASGRLGGEGAVIVYLKKREDHGKTN